MARLTVRGLHKRYGKVHALRGIDLDIAEGEFCVFVGPSGCGKSTLLRTIAGLEDVDAGSIAIGGQPVDGVRPRDRDIAMVFQNYALYPYLNVFENVAFGLRARRFAEAEIRARVDRAAAMLGIGHLLGRFPRELSGGQRQRVAIGRAIVRDARLFLFDEPLSNLDAQLRDGMRAEIKRLHQEIGKTTVYVTHDQVEAMTLADRIVLLRDGLVEQEGAPLDLFERPATRFVAGFLGSPAMNFVPLPPGGTRRRPRRALRRRPRAAAAARPGGPVRPLARPRHDPGHSPRAPEPGRRRAAAARASAPDRDRRPGPAHRHARLRCLPARRRRGHRRAAGARGGAARDRAAAAGGHEPRGPHRPAERAGGVSRRAGRGYCAGAGCGAAESSRWTRAPRSCRSCTSSSLSSRGRVSTRHSVPAQLPPGRMRGQPA
jgi:multiple sugar transport system ATP-binding protein